MNKINLNNFHRLILALLLVSTPLGLYAQGELEQASNMRVSIVSIDALVTAIDYETRELSLRGPQGNIVTITAGDQIERLADIAVGDTVTTTYITSLAGELREPTDEEIAHPWIEIDAAAKADETNDPGAVVGRVIRAVCTIEGMNRVTRTVSVLDPRGRYHVIGGIDPAKMEGVTLGATVVMSYSEAMAITLEKKATVAE